MGDDWAKGLGPLGFAMGMKGEADGVFDAAAFSAFTWLTREIKWFSGPKQALSFLSSQSLLWEDTPRFCFHFVSFWSLITLYSLLHCYPWFLPFSEEGEEREEGESDIFLCYPRKINEDGQWCPRKWCAEGPVSAGKKRGMLKKKIFYPSRWIPLDRRSNGWETVCWLNFPWQSVVREQDPYINSERNSVRTCRSYVAQLQ